MIDAGLTGTLARWLRRAGALPWASASITLTASSGTLARARAASTSAGKPCAKVLPQIAPDKAAKARIFRAQRVDAGNRGMKD